MKPYTYLIINVLTIIICFIFSFHPKIRFNRYFIPFIKASALVAIPFIAWDVWFTYSGVWWFNGDYVIRANLAGMPVEEWLFFICIPFSCVFTYYCLDKFFSWEWAEKLNKPLMAAGLITCLALAVVFNGKTYTLVTSLAGVAAIAYLYFAKFKSFTKASLTYLILMFGFIPVNGTLTGSGLESPIVNYNPQEIIGFRVLTIPIEDFVYGYALILLNIHFFEFFRKHKKSDIERS